MEKRPKVKFRQSVSRTKLILMIYNFDISEEASQSKTPEKSQRKRKADA